ncbi:MAG TPA: hypothetical protein V6D00_04325 [Pantanalinema sp.]
MKALRVLPLLTLTAVFAAAGCGLTPSQVASTKQDAVISPYALTGDITFNLSENGGYSTQATAADVATFAFEISSSVLSAPRTQVFTKASLPADKRVSFKELAPGAYTVKSTAKDATGKVIGTVTGSTTVVAGKSSVLKLSLKLADTELDNPNGNLYFDLEILDGDLKVKPIEEPATPSATPTPTPSATPSPAPSVNAIAMYNLATRVTGSGAFEVKGSLYNVDTVVRVAEVKVEFKKKKLFSSEYRVTETKVVPVVVNAKTMQDFTIVSDDEAASASVSFTAK